MKWFGRKSVREGARPALSRAGTFAGAIGEWPRSYEAQVREAYCHNPVAQRAVKLVAEGAGSAALKASDPALLALVTARSGGQPLIETLAAQLLLHGNGYVQILADDSGAVRELYALRPERVSVEPDARGWPVAYRYKVGENVARLAAEDGAGRPAVVHIRAFSPIDDHYGLGCLGAAAGAVAIHNAAARWNKALLDNAARPSGALVHDPGDGSVLAPDQFARLADLRGAGRCGAGAGGRDRGGAGRGGGERRDGGAGGLCGAGDESRHGRAAAGGRRRRLVRRGAGVALRAGRGHHDQR